MSDLPLSDQEIRAFFERLEERVGVRLDLSKNTCSSRVCRHLVWKQTTPASVTLFDF